MRIDEITIGARHRRDLGDVAALARSIAEMDLRRRDLAAGVGRLEAFLNGGMDDGSGSEA